MKNVLIYVLSAEMAPYPALREAAKATWDAQPLIHTETLYYTASQVPTAGVMVNLPIPDSLYDMGRKDIAAYQWALANRQWDYMARVNASCYVRKQQVLAICQTLPATGVFRGVGAPGGAVPAPVRPRPGARRRGRRPAHAPHAPRRARDHPRHRRGRAPPRAPPERARARVNGSAVHSHALPAMS